MRAGPLRSAPLAGLVSAHHAVHAGPCSIIRVASAWRKKLQTHKCGSAYPNCAICSPRCYGAGGTALSTCCIGPSGEDDINSELCAATIESADRDQVVGAHAELVFPEDEVLIAEADDGDGAVASLLVGAQLGIDGGHAESAAHQDDRAFELADVARQAERADEIEDGIALAQGQHFERGFAHRLDDYGDRAVGHIEIGHGQRDAFPMLVDASHHKVSGTCCSHRR